MFGIYEDHPEVQREMSANGLTALTAINVVRARHMVLSRLRTDGRAIRQRSYAKW